MKTKFHSSRGLQAALLSCVVLLGTGVAVLAAAEPSSESKAPYPLSTCVVSGEKLGGGDMGPPVDYIHKEEGKPDRLVRLCCKGCIKDFKKDPAKYLKMIDDASAAPAKNGHAGHH
jgi:hypothetical protein